MSGLYLFTRQPVTGLGISAQIPPSVPGHIWPGPRNSSAIRVRVRHQTTSSSTPTPPSLGYKRPQVYANRPATGGARPSISRARWSTNTMVALACFVGTATYSIGRIRSIEEKTLRQIGVDLEPVPPTTESFRKALDAVREKLPPDCIDTDRYVLLAHGQSGWSYHKATELPGAVIYPRSTEDVAEIVKIANNHNIPLVPFAGGTSLEGHFNAPSTTSQSSSSKAKNTLLPSPDDLPDLDPGLSFCLDFNEHMDKVIKVNAADMDVIVQPGLKYEVLNQSLKEQGHNLFFPVDPGPGAEIGGMVATGI